MKKIEVLASLLILIGALNWGLIAAFNYNLITSLLGDGNGSKMVYGLVGVCALYQLMQMMKARMAAKSS
ncbi:MAG: DUF378 domain-containing protein [Cyanobacteria bacterium SZAS LIN-2]|nr:DUF378 domain-containing protein [Cyanobacteria bacterium SZAS LIN-3]MBS1995614.1 DUF378 domain-containing protein [Cyanobacteria bacterium SZAS LIN-2]MBS2005975.1 DUF378 domain-containing protein [Cyanobacteria bacterium SZAS TMP-1]